jgi:DNA-binding response OmpR family regulator
MSRILVIDDDPVVRNTLQLILSGAGHQVTLACDGHAGIRAFGDLRNLSSTVPIVAISGGGRVGNMDFLAAARQFGADRSFAKPFDPDQVLDAINELLLRAAAA